MKVLHLVSSINRGGKERQIVTIMKYSKNIENMVGYLYESTWGYDIPDDLLSKFHKIRGKGYLSYAFNLTRLLILHKIDVVYTWGIKETSIALIARLFTKFNLVNGSIRHGLRIKGNKAQTFRMFLSHLTKNVVANSRAGLKVNNLKKGYVLYNGLDKELIKSIKPRSSSNLSNKTILLSIGNLVPYKDYFTVLPVIKKISSEFDIEYHILGEGCNRASIENYIDQNDLSSTVFLQGSVKNVADYLLNSNIFIHSSKGEGCSNAIIEAMASGLPIIATDVGGNSEIVSVRNAILFSFGSQNELEQAIRKLIVDKVLRNSMSKASKEIAFDKFHWSIMVDNYEKIIRTVTNQES